MVLDPPALWEKALYGENCEAVRNILESMFPGTSFSFVDVHPVMDDEDPLFVKLSSYHTPPTSLRVTGIFLLENELYFRVK
jgi:hypothetical protein